MYFRGIEGISMAGPIIFRGPTPLGKSDHYLPTAFAHYFVFSILLTMPYFKTSEEWYEQSSLLLKARPTSVQHDSSLKEHLPLTAPPDSNNLKIHSAETNLFQNKETSEIRRKESLQASRTRSGVIASSAIAKFRRSDRHVHTKDVRSRVRDMPSI